MLGFTGSNPLSEMKALLLPMLRNVENCDQINRKELLPLKIRPPKLSLSVWVLAYLRLRVFACLCVFLRLSLSFSLCLSLSLSVSLSVPLCLSLSEA